MAGTCNLECWCHVPRRGRSKPPCYLCVIQDCSHSCSSVDSSSAAALHPKEYPEDPAPSYQDVVAAASVWNSSEGKTTYGWRPELTLHLTDYSSLSINTVDTEHKSLNTETYDLRVQVKHDEGAVGGPTDVIVPNAASESPVNIHASGDLLTTEEDILDQVVSVSPEPLGRQSPLELQRGHSSDALTGKVYEPKYSGVKRSYETRNARDKWDLSDRIKSLVLGTDDCLFQDSCSDHLLVHQEWDAEESGALGIFPLHEDTPRPKAIRPDRQGTSRVGSRSSLVAGKKLGISQPSLTSESLIREEEEEYRRINKINRRETAKEAAQRHLQRTENLLPRRRWRQSGQRLLALARGGTMAFPGSKENLVRSQAPAW
ncbi:uncharacterized protein [Panulirus ornatus]|uniref:uncharacterized protein n=1 Tax=Panulirus ornatus TaxID=150431 RepID=UPI003A8892F7